MTSLAIYFGSQSEHKWRLIRYLYPAGFFSVWFGGIGPGLLSGVYGCTAFLIIALRETQTQDGLLHENLVDLMFFAFFGFAFCYMVARSRKAKDQITRMYQELKNITFQLSQREQALGLAVRARDDFFSIASHELKTPITALKLQVQLLERQLKKEKNFSNLSSGLSLIEEQIVRLTNLIESLLDTTRIAKGSLTLDIEELDFKELIQKIFERYEGLLKASGCEYQIESEGAPWVRCDRYRMEQVITNLLANAVKYAAGKPIKVHLKNLGNEFEVYIKDGGPGISKENITQLFAPFSRARTSDKRIPGLGLGLFIAKQIVEAHQGKIECTSKEGEGTQFKLNLQKLSTREANCAFMAFDNLKDNNLNRFHQRYATTFSD